MPQIVEQASSTSGTDVSKAFADDAARSRAVVETANAKDVAKNAKRYQVWRCTADNVRIHILHGSTQFDPVTRESRPMPGLNVRFRGGVYILDKEHPKFAIIQEGLRRSQKKRPPNQMVCMDDLSGKDKRKAELGILDTNPNSVLGRVGIRSDKQRKLVSEILDLYATEATSDKDAVISKLRAENAALKVGKSVGRKKATTPPPPLGEDKT